MADGTWASCLVVVTAFDDVAPAVARVVAAAERGLAATPALMDFIELRFASAGPRPQTDEGHTAVVRALADELARPTRGAPENFLALVVIDDDAADVAALLDAAGTAFAGHELEIRLAGFAVAGDEQRAAGGAIGILGAEAGLETRMTDALLFVCEQLMEAPSVDGARGATLEALEALRAPAPGSEPAPEPRQTLAALSAVAPAPAEDDEADAPQAAGSTGPPIVAAVFGALVGAPMDGDRRAFRRAQRLMLDLDAHLAGESDAGAGLVFHVSVVGPGATGPARLRPAGALRRRDVPRPDPTDDFARHLRAIGEAVAFTVDESRRRRQPATRPAVVLVALEAPPADPVATAAFHRLTASASVTWVFLDGGETLLAPALRDGDDTVLAGPSTTAVEVFERLILASAPTAPVDPAPAPSPTTTP